MADLDLLLAHIARSLGDIGELTASEEDRYSSLPLCIIDAIYSIGARYESTERTVSDFCVWASWEDRTEHGVREFLALLAPFRNRWDQLATDVFRNRQRTSPRAGILKAEAVYRFAEGLAEFGVDMLGDLAKSGVDDRLRERLTAVHGQASGTSFKYFLMLAGHSGYVKPDRMVIRFVAEALGTRSVEPEIAETLIQAACYSLKPALPGLTPSLLDYAIWRHQRSS